MNNQSYITRFLDSKNSIKISAVMVTLFMLSAGAAAFQPGEIDFNSSDIDSFEEDLEDVQHAYSSNTDGLDIGFSVGIFDSYESDEDSNQESGTETSNSTNSSEPGDTESENGTNSSESSVTDGDDSSESGSGSSSSSSTTVNNIETEEESFGFSTQLHQVQNNVSIAVNVSEPVNLTFMRNGDEMVTEEVDDFYNYSFELEGDLVEEVSVVSEDRELSSFTVEPVAEANNSETNDIGSGDNLEGNFSVLANETDLISENNHTEGSGSITGQYSSEFPDFMSETFEIINNRMDLIQTKFESWLEEI